MTRTRTRKALYLGLPIFLILVGGGLLAWKTFGPSEAGYPRKVMKRAEELHERILSLDSRITIPPDFGTEGDEFDKDGPTSSTWSRRAAGACPALPWRSSAGRRCGTARTRRTSRPPVSSTKPATSRKFVTRFSPAWSATSRPGRHRLLPEDFRRLAMEGKFAIVMSMLNAYPLGDDLSSWTNGPPAACACSAWIMSATTIGPTLPSLAVLQRHGGCPGRPLPLGKQAVERLNDLG